ncbi:MAG: regulator of chromosome condensation repeat family protein [Aeromicrobium sp.]|nr:regulator of chromosome condensation repeat family protein [Aeromicrobium sp.]
MAAALAAAALLAPGAVGSADAVTTPAPLKIASGEHFTIVVGANGLPYATGDGNGGALGGGTYTSKSTLTKMTGLPAGVTARGVTAGDFHSLVLGSNGTVYGAGNNEDGELAAAPLSSSDNRNTLTAMPLPGGVLATAIGAGRFTSFAIGADHKVYGTGDNSGSQLGLPKFTNKTAWTALAAPATEALPIAVAGGYYHVVVLYSDGTVYGAGDNGYGQITGVATASRDTLQPMVVPAGHAIAIAAGALDSIVISDNGVAYGAGDNTWGELGVDPTVIGNDRLEALTAMAGLPSGVKAVTGAVGGNHTVVIGDDGKAYGTGWNADSQLTGTDDNDRRATFKAMTGLTGKTAVQASTGFEEDSVVRTSTGGVFGTGLNGYHQLTGTGDRTTLTAFTGLPSAGTLKFTASVKPKISGTVKVGHTLSIAHNAKTGWSPDATSLAYKWYRGSSAIGGATKSTYKLKTADKGHKIRVKIYGKRSGYTTGTYTTASTGTVK